MNIREYLDNPMGKGAIIPGKQAIINDYNTRFDKLIEDKKFSIKIYKDKDDYYFHIIQVTESERENDYDVVIKFYPKDKTNKAEDSIINYEVSFFSNCPSFTYTYAYAYNNAGLLIDILAKKYDEKILSMAPVVKNPSNMINFEKSLYFACKYILYDPKYVSKTYLKSAAQKFGKRNFINSIRTNNMIEFEIQKANKVLQEKKKKEARKNSKLLPHNKNKMKKENSANVVKYTNPKKSTVQNKPKSSVNKIKAKKSTSSANNVKIIKGRKR